MPCDVCANLTHNQSVRLARIDIEETYCVPMFQVESDESLTKGMVNQSRQEGNCIHRGRWKNELTSSCVPDSDVGNQHARSFSSSEYSA